MASLSMAPDLQQQIRDIPGNKKCVDCLRRNPQWASVTMGTLMCLECSGKHRGLGVHISFVRSVQMDSWSPKQIQAMQIGGNDRFRDYLTKNNISNDMDIPSKYNQSEVALYALQIRAKRDGKPIPTSLPTQKPKSHSTGQLSSSSESPQEREIRLRREAEERLRKKFGGTNLRGQGVSSSGQPFGSGDDGGRNSGRSSGLDEVGKSVGAAANVAGQALGQAFDWLGSTAKSTVDTVREKKIGDKVSSGWNTVSNKVKSGEVTAAVSNGWSSFMSGATSLLRQVSGNEGGQQQDSREGVDSEERQMQQEQQYTQQNTSGSRGNDDDAWLQEQLSQAKNRLSQQQSSSSRSSSRECAQSSSLSVGDDNDTGDDGWGNNDDDKDSGAWDNEDHEDLELFLKSDDDDDEGGTTSTSVLDMTATSRGNSGKLQPKGMKLGSGVLANKKKTSKVQAKKATSKTEDDDFFGSFGF